MYSITVINQTGEYVLHNAYDEDFKLGNPVLDLELNKSGTLTFTINPDHPSRAQILPMASEIFVYDDDLIYWVGRPLDVDGDFDMVATVTCEGVLGYLLDTQVPPFNFTEGNSIRGSDCIKQFLKRLIDAHNSKVGSSGWGARKRFTVNNVTVLDSNNNLARSSEDYQSTLETINEKLLQTHGGYFRVRYGTDKVSKYIDYVETYGAASQAITFGENLLDLNTHTNADSIYTAVIPEGAQIEDTDNRVTLSGYSPTTAVKNQISEYTHGGSISWMNAASYFNGFYCIKDAAGINAHGVILAKQTWDDVTTQQNLALKAAKWIGAASVLGTKIELSAVDLSRISVDYKRFNLGEMVQVISIPHGINAEYQISKMTADLANPANSSMVLGGDLGTFTFENTKQVAEISQKITEDIPAAIQNATTLLSGGLGGYLIIRQDDNGQPYEILIMNAATESSATRCVRINQNGIGFGTSSVGSTYWSYRNAWTIDGDLVADFITTGTLKDSAGNTQFNLGTGQFTMKKGSINLGSGNFTVSDAGVMTAKSVNIGGFMLTNAVDGRYALYQDSPQGIYRTWIRGATTSAGGNTWVFSAQQKSGNTYYPAFKVEACGITEINPLLGGSRFYVGDLNVEITAAQHLYLTGPKGYIYLNTTGLRVDPGNQTTAHSGNLYRNGAGYIYAAQEGASSRKIKHDIKPVENDELDPNRLYDVEVIQYKYNDDFLSDDDPNRGKDLIGFIVEDLEEVYPVAVSKDDPDDSKTWTWSPIRLIPGMLKLIQDQKKQIDDMESRIAKLEEVITKLTEGEENHG